jgi:hypothetical protein
VSNQNRVFNTLIDHIPEMTTDADFGEAMKAILLQATPEKRDELEQHLQGVSFVEDKGTERISFGTIAAWKLVRVPKRCQSRLWAQCYAYFCNFAAFVANWDGLSPQTRYDLSESDLKKAGEMLEWATNVDVSVRVQRRAGRPIEVEAVPNDMPVPISGQAPEFVQHHAEQVFLHAFAFILHHELSHIRLGHAGTKGEVPIEEEFDADRAAIEFMVSTPNLSEHDYLLRHLGIAIALLWFTTIDFFERYEKRAHPPSWERLYRALEPSLEDECNAIWGFVALALRLHFRRVGISLDSMKDFGPTRETVRALLDLLQRHNQSLE